MKTKYLFLALLFASVVLPLQAQREDLTHDRDFFQNQQLLYQRWLDHSGMGKTLRVKTVEVEAQQVALYLAFPTENADSVNAGWAQLKKDYATLNTGLSLEQALFYKMQQLIELRGSVANVQLYDTYDTCKEPCFYRAITSKRMPCRWIPAAANPKTWIFICRPTIYGGLKNPAFPPSRSNITQQYVFDKIYRYAQQRYEKETCFNRHPKVSAPQVDGNVLRFEVTDLCKEVLKNAQNPDIRAFLNAHVKPCNWITREKLTFTLAAIDSIQLSKYSKDFHPPDPFYEKMVFVEGGVFEMGCRPQSGQDCPAVELPVHQVKLSSFYIGKFEVTQQDWLDIMAVKAPGLTPFCPNCPVVGISWDMTQDFLNRLNYRTARNYRLPTEAEWEYTARGGAKTKDYPYAGGQDLDLVAWHDGNSKGSYHPIQQNAPNEIYLYDMSGNVCEWCEDKWHEDCNGAPVDGRSWVQKGTIGRVFRGGCWNRNYLRCQSSARYWDYPYSKFDNVGFRLARTN